MTINSNLLRKIAAALLAVVLAVCCCACSNSAKLIKPDSTSAEEQSASESKSVEPEPPEPSEPELPEVEDLGKDENFNQGNIAYKDGDWLLAEAHYRKACEQEESSGDINPEIYYSFYASYLNNLGLALLQQGIESKDEEALEIYRWLVRINPWEYGYWVNLLVGAHACGISARDIFDQEAGEYIASDLAANAELDDAYPKLLAAIYYNAAYMDMETPADMPEDWFDYSALPGEYESQFTDIFNEVYASSGDPYEALMFVLEVAASYSEERYGETDQDFYDLLDYLHAKSASEQ